MYIYIPLAGQGLKSEAAGVAPGSLTLVAEHVVSNHQHDNQSHHSAEFLPYFCNTDDIVDTVYRDCP